MMNIARKTIQVFELIPRAWNRLVVSKIKKAAFAECGVNVRIGRRVKIEGYENIVCGDNVAIGADCRFLSTRARIILKDHVMFGPAVTVVTGNHRIDIKDRYIMDITDEEKRPEDDQDVIFEGDNWIGANSMILKGVTIGRGSVVGGGTLVSHSVPPYAIVAGNPARIVKSRFDFYSESDFLQSGTAPITRM